MSTLYFEDFVPGRSWTLGDHEVSTAAIVQFGEQYDPQPFHVDEEAATRSPFGGLVASGWQTSAITARILVEELYSRSASLGSPGVEALRWTRPVRPGDRLSVTFVVTDARPSTSRPDRGIVRCAVTTSNQAGEVVMTLDGTMFFARRDPA